MATFFVATVFAFTSRNSLAIAGNIIDGEIEKGMYVFSADEKHSFKIDSIESLRTEAHADTGLLIKSEDIEVLSFLKEMENNTVRIGFKPY